MIVGVISFLMLQRLILSVAYLGVLTIGSRSPLNWQKNITKHGLPFVGAIEVSENLASL